MQMKQIALAVAAAAASLSAQTSVHASLTPAQADAAIGAGRVVYNAGASAPTNITYEAFIRMCQDGTAAVFTHANLGAHATPGDAVLGNNLAYACKLRTDLTGLPTGWGGNDMVFVTSVEGGSINSVVGMSTNAAQQVNFLNNFGATTTCVNSGFTTTDGRALPIWRSCGRGKLRAHGGFSDVERQLWNNNFTADPAASDYVAPPAGVTLSQVSATAVNAYQPFALAVSNALYEALQTAQGIPGSTRYYDLNRDGDFADLGETVLCLLGNASPACQPNITKRQYASITNNNPASPTKTDWAWLVGTPGIGQKVNLCRRADTSGTQKSSEMYFLGNPVLRWADRAGARPAANSVDSTASFNVFEGSGTGNAKECLSGVDLNNNGTVDGGTTPASWSIGVLSAENTWGPGETWKYVKLDGVAVNEDSLHVQSSCRGAYDFAMQLILHRNTAGGVTPAAVNTFYTKLVGDMASLSLPAITGIWRGADTACFGGKGGNNAQVFTR
ncbi:MAG: hypothetical protein KGZ43_05125 [Sulfuritalea sp.]|nr:hypothetical protein [Sulfuritalea sp.]